MVIKPECAKGSVRGAGGGTGRRPWPPRWTAAAHAILGFFSFEPPRPMGTSPVAEIGETLPRHTRFYQTGQVSWMQVLAMGAADLICKDASQRAALLGGGAG